MNMTRLAVKAFAGTVATTVLVLGSLAGPADAAAAKAGAGVSTGGAGGAVTMRKDTGWG